MYNESDYLRPTFGNYKALITQSTSERVKQINDFILDYFAKKSIIKYGFFPVLRIIEKEQIYIKLYYYDYRIVGSKREMEDFSAQFYKSEISGLSYSSCNIMSIPLETKVTAEVVNSCKSMDEMELTFLNTLKNDSWVGLDLTVYQSFSTRYDDWKKILEVGNVKPRYEAKCKIELEREITEINKKKEIREGITEGIKSVKINVFMKTGGPQPEFWDAGEIDNFFKGNLAKRWAMCDGYLPTYTGYNNGVIHFNLVTDPRCTNVFWISLCNHIANQYKEHVKLLKDATHFKAEHFIANDIIGFNITGSEMDNFDKYDDRVQATYASLPLKPKVTHYGKIR